MSILNRLWTAIDAFTAMLNRVTTLGNAVAGEMEQRLGLPSTKDELNGSRHRLVPPPRRRLQSKKPPANPQVLATTKSVNTDIPVGPHAGTDGQLPRAGLTRYSLLKSSDAVLRLLESQKSSVVDETAAATPSQA